MPRKTSDRSPVQPEQSSSESPRGKSELVVVMKSSGPRALRQRGAAPEAFPSAMAETLDAAGATLKPLFKPKFEPSLTRAAAPEAALEGQPDLSAFFHVDAPEEEKEDLARRLRELDEVEAAYIKPPGEPPRINDMRPKAQAPAGPTPDFSSRQIYLNTAPAGINARLAWNIPGGRGQGIRIIDCEWGWRFTHEDLTQNQGGVAIGTNDPDDDHGTAVLGVYSGDLNPFGIIGICPEASTRAASFFDIETATVIQQAADLLRPGDILLLEIHRPGPAATGIEQEGFIPIEWWPDDLAAIRYAVSRGIIVVEAAGNGGQNLDDPLYDIPHPAFPESWRNPLNPANPGSGAILVGAGAPPPGTHGTNHGPDRSRLDFSNYGKRVDTQGWGREVTTAGYGTLQGGGDPDFWYTDEFSGTSSASPIVVGALACVQGILLTAAKPLLTPGAARQLLRVTGSPQQDAPGRPRTQRIGNRPDLRQMISQVIGLPPEALEQSSREIEVNVDERLTVESEANSDLDGRSTPLIVHIHSPGATIHFTR